MAVDERRRSTTGTSRNITQNCGPCERDEEHLEARGYCVDCQDYLCDSCFKSHGRNKASRNHKLVTLDQISSTYVSKIKSNTCMEICNLHKEEYIKFFCQQHKSLACNDCVILNHRTCAIDYIPDKCKGISNSTEFKTTVKALAQELEDLNSLILKNNVKDSIKAYLHDKCIRDINNFQAEINERIEQLRKHIQQVVNEQKSKNKENIKKARDTLQTMKSGVEQSEKDMNKYITTNQEGQLFISMKKAHSVLEENERNLGRFVATTEHTFYKFESGNRIKELLAESDIFGKLQPQYLESVENLEPVTNGIVVLNMPDDVTHDAIRTYFRDTRQSRGGEIITVDVHTDENYCLDIFEDQTVVPRVCQKEDHIISGHRVDVRSCNELLRIPYSLSLDDHDPFILQYCKENESKRLQIETELSKHHAMILWGENHMRVQSVLKTDDKCISKDLQLWKAEVSQVIRRTTDNLNLKVVTLSEDVWEKAIETLKTLVILKPDKIAVCVNKINHQIKILSENQYDERDLKIIIETLKSIGSNAEG